MSMRQLNCQCQCTAISIYTFSGPLPKFCSKYSHEITKDLGSSQEDPTTYFPMLQRKLPNGFLLYFSFPEAFPVPSPISSHIPGSPCHFLPNGILMGVSIFFLQTCDPCTLNSPKPEPPYCLPLQHYQPLQDSGSHWNDITHLEKCWKGPKARH